MHGSNVTVALPYATVVLLIAYNPDLDLQSMHCAKCEPGLDSVPTGKVCFWE